MQRTNKGIQLRSFSSPKTKPPLPDRKYMHEPFWAELLAKTSEKETLETTLLPLPILTHPPYQSACGTPSPAVKNNVPSYSQEPVPTYETTVYSSRPKIKQLMPSVKLIGV